MKKPHVMWQPVAMKKPLYGPTCEVMTGGNEEAPWRNEMQVVDQ